MSSANDRTDSRTFAVAAVPELVERTAQRPRGRGAHEHRPGRRSVVRDATRSRQAGGTPLVATLHQAGSGARRRDGRGRLSPVDRRWHRRRRTTARPRRRELAQEWSAAGRAQGAHGRARDRPGPALRQDDCRRRRDRRRGRDRFGVGRQGRRAAVALALGRRRMRERWASGGGGRDAGADRPGVTAALKRGSLAWTTSTGPRAGDRSSGRARRAASGHFGVSQGSRRGVPARSRRSETSDRPFRARRLVVEAERECDVHELPAAVREARGVPAGRRVRHRRPTSTTRSPARSARTVSATSTP